MILLRWISTLVLAHLGIALTAVVAQAPKETAPKTEDLRLRQICRDELLQYSLGFPDSPTTKFVSHEVLTWSNPVRDRQLGVVSVWIASGRVEAIGTVFTHPRSPDMVQLQHELQSLSLRRLQADLPSGERRWATAKPGIEFQTIQGAPQPAETPAQRLLQMRALARQFSAHSIDRRDSRWELRLLPQPLYRYESGAADVVDGALFAFLSTAGTDPELLLLIEARPAGDATAWEMAAARFSDHSLYLQHQDRDVWSFVNTDRQVEFAAGVNDTYRFVFERFIPSPSGSP